MCSPRKSNKIFLIFTFYESKQMSLTQDLRWSLGRSTALQLQRQTDLLLCTINCFLQWDHLPNMAVGDVAFYYTLYLCASHLVIKGTISDRPFQTSLFSDPQIFFFFCIFRENLTVITYLYNNSLGNSIFLETETILCSWELIAGNNWFKPYF